MPDPNLIATARAAATKFGIPPELFLAQINAESSFNPNPGSPSYVAPDGSSPAGIAQFIGSTAKAYGVTDRMDPTASLYGAAAYDADLYKQKGSWSKVLAGYGTTSGDALKTNPAAKIANDIANTVDSGGTVAGGASGVSDAGLGTASSAPSGTGGSATPVSGPAGSPQGSGILGAPGTVGGGASTVLDYVIRAGIIILGVVIIWQGLAMMRGGSVAEHLQVVVKGAKSRAEKVAAAT